MREWIVFQGEREDAAGVDFEFGNAVPARVNLGGLQDFTPWRETEEDADFADYVREIKKETHKRPKGYAPWRPQNKTVRLIRQVKQALYEYQAYLPLTARQIFYRLVDETVRQQLRRWHLYHVPRPLRRRACFLQARPRRG